MDLIQIQKERFGLNIDGSYQFFYDETNNFRKLKVREQDFNNKLETFFIVGGLVYSDVPDLEQVLKDSRVQSKGEEVKFNHFANGKFEACLKSLNLRLFLKSLNENNLRIHYSVTNALYWAIVDIVDTVLVDQKLLHLHGYLKTTLYIVAKNEQETLHSLFLLSDFPNVSNEAIDLFYAGIQAMLAPYATDPQLSAHVQCLIQVIEMARKKSDWVSLLDDEQGLLFDNNGILYARSVAFFHNSEHIFDNESQLQSGFSEKVASYAMKPLTNYRFTDSKSSLAVQISDVIVGTVSRYYDFLDSHTPSELKCKLLEIDHDEYQKEVLMTINDLINKSIQENKAFIHSIIPLTVNDNLNIVSEHYERSIP